MLVFIGCLSEFFFFFKQKTAYEMRISDWSSDVCSSDLFRRGCAGGGDDDAAQRLALGVGALLGGFEFLRIGAGGSSIRTLNASLITNTAARSRMIPGAGGFRHGLRRPRPPRRTARQPRRDPHLARPCHCVVELAEAKTTEN